MAVKNFREGLRLVPVSADPVNPREGQLQRSDGTHRPRGIYEFIDGQWILLGGNASATATDINCVTMINDSFDSGALTGWTFSTTNTSASTVASVETVDPIAGAGSALIEIDIDGTGINIGGSGGPTQTVFETNVSLTPFQMEADKITLEFDISFEDFETAFLGFDATIGMGSVIYAFNLNAQVIETTSGTSVVNHNIAFSSFDTFVRINATDVPTLIDNQVVHAIIDFTPTPGIADYTIQIVHSEEASNA